MKRETEVIKITVAEIKNVVTKINTAVTRTNIEKNQKVTKIGVMKKTRIKAVQIAKRHHHHHHHPEIKNTKAHQRIKIINLKVKMKKIKIDTGVTRINTIGTKISTPVQKIKTGIYRQVFLIRI